MFHLAVSDIMQVASPSAVRGEVLCNVLGKQDVPRIATTHHPLSCVQASSRDIRPIIYVQYAADRAAMNPHPNAHFGVIAQSCGDLNCTIEGRFDIIGENKRHAVTSWETNKFSRFFRLLK